MDIRKGEGIRGVPLLLDLQFVDVNTCLPVPNAMIDVWHCNVSIFDSLKAMTPR